MFVIQIYVQNHFWQSQRDSKTLWELFWNTKEKIIFSWKTFFFKKIFISKFFQKSLIGGDFDFLDEFDSVWDPKKHQKSFFKVLKWHQNNLRTILKLKRKNDFLMKIFFLIFWIQKISFFTNFAQNHQKLPFEATSSGPRASAKCFWNF